jgi:hypothetical protein
MEQEPGRPQTEAQTAAEQERLRKLRLAEHLQNQQQPPAPPTRTAGRGGAGRGGAGRGGAGRGTAWKVATAVVVAVAVGWGAMNAFSPGVETVTAEQKTAWAASWAAAPPQVAKVIAPAQVQAALDEMHLTPEQRAQVQQQLDDGKTRLVYLTFTDVMAEDLDRVKVDSGDFATEVTIWNKTTKVIFPEPSGGIVNVSGVYDGGGGITIAITSGDTPVNLPFMTVGQSVGIPVVAVQ